VIVTNSGLRNYYGEVNVEVEGDCYYMTLENYSSNGRVSVSKEFYDAFVKEFPERKKQENVL
jgi:hypothetical protein